MYFYLISKNFTSFFSAPSLADAEKLALSIAEERGIKEFVLTDKKTKVISFKHST